MSIVGCPDCGAPAEVTERFILPSTDGPVDHVVVVCSAGHHFRMPAEGLSVAADEHRSVLRVLFLVSAHGGLSQAREVALTDLGHRVVVSIVDSADSHQARREFAYKQSPAGNRPEIHRERRGAGHYRA